LLIGVNYRSKSFRLLSSESTVAPLDYAFNHSEILLSAKIDQHLGSWIWTSVKAGYQVNFSSEFDSTILASFLNKRNTFLYMRIINFLKKKNSNYSYIIN